MNKKRKRLINISNIPSPIDPDDEDFWILKNKKDREYFTLITRRCIYNDLTELEFIININKKEYNYLMIDFRGYN